jgi:transposase
MSMKAYSIDLRQRIVDAVDAGTSREQVAEQFQVSLSSVQRYLRQRRQIGTLAAKVSPGRPRRIRLEEHGMLSQQLSQHNDATLEQHCQLWMEQSRATKSTTVSLGVSQATMWRAIERLGWTRKKESARQ